MVAVGGEGSRYCALSGTVTVTGIVIGAPPPVSRVLTRIVPVCTPGFRKYVLAVTRRFTGVVPVSGCTDSQPPSLTASASYRTCRPREVMYNTPADEPSNCIAEGNAMNCGGSVTVSRT